MYEGKPVLDVHSHVRALVPTASYLSLLLGSNMAFPSPISGSGNQDLAAFMPQDKATMVPMASDEDFKSVADRHANYIEARSIDVQLLGPHPVEIHGWLPPHLFAAWTTFANDVIFKVCQARPDRFVGAAQLPQSAVENDTAHVLPELERCVSEYNFVAAYVSPDISGRRDTPALGQPYWYPLFEYCEEQGLPIVVHGSSSQDPRMASSPMTMQLTFAMEQYYALWFLRHSDTFERFPGLRVLICHCGGALDRFIAESPLVTPNPERDLSENLFFDTCAYDLDFLAAAISQRSPSQMCFGSEAPGAGGTPRPDTGTSSDDLVPIFADHPKLAFLSGDEKRQMLHGNPARFCPGLADPLATNGKAKAVA